ncbi:hypothetical protein V866_002595 [Kwoniella sp. B9012]|uniref:Uncharacterized protein n=1 Tax=Kwoniella europaea PYCC6329 TaxID=1423913 RepID=A0AAX4KG09_9TREE
MFFGSDVKYRVDGDTLKSTESVESHGQTFYKLEVKNRPSNLLTYESTLDYPKLVGHLSDDERSFTWITAMKPSSIIVLTGEGMEYVALRKCIRVPISELEKYDYQSLIRKDRSQWTKDEPEFYSLNNSNTTGRQGKDDYCNRLAIGHLKNQYFCKDDLEHYRNKRDGKSGANKKI